MKDASKKKCPECGKMKLERLISFTLGFVKDIKTVGQLADHNTKTMGKYELEDKRRNLKNKRQQGKEVLKEEADKKRWWGEYNKELANLTPKQKKQYIEEGRYDK